MSRKLCLVPSLAVLLIVLLVVNSRDFFCEEAEEATVIVIDVDTVIMKPLFIEKGNSIIIAAGITLTFLGEGSITVNKGGTLTALGLPLEKISFLGMTAKSICINEGTVLVQNATFGYVSNGKSVQVKWKVDKLCLSDISISGVETLEYEINGGAAILSNITFDSILYVLLCAPTGKHIISKMMLKEKSASMFL